jgi:ATP-dependent RNA helicase DeaD
VQAKFAPIPTADEIRRASMDRVFEDLTGPDPEGFKGFDEATWGLAKRLAQAPLVPRTIARLLSHTRYAGVSEPRTVRVIAPPSDEAPPKKKSPPTTSVNEAAKRAQSFALFTVTWGREHGADPRRLLALICRRGGVERESIGAIRIGPRSSTVEVESGIAGAFASRASRPDPRDERVRIFPASDRPDGGEARPKKPKKKS